MNKLNRQVIRILCVLVLMIAMGIVLDRKGYIPHFWEAWTASAVEDLEPEDIITIDAQEESENTTAETGPVNTDSEELAEESQADASDASDQDMERDPSDTKDSDAEGTDELSEDATGIDQTEEPEAELSSAEILEAYLSEDPRKPVQAKGIYVSGPIAGTKNTMPELIELAKKTEINTMVIDIKNDGGEITYKMDLPLAQEIGADIRYVADMPVLIQELKEQGIYLIARIVAFKDPILAEKKPEYAVKNPDGSVFYDNNHLAWVNPYNEAVWDYLIDVSKKAVELGFDEIQYDYIRFSTAKGISEADFGSESAGKTKQEAINGFLTRAYETLAPMGVFVSADVFGTIICSESDGELIGQNYAEMAKHCDYICPMIYPSHYVNGSYGIKIPDAKPYDLIKVAVADGERKLSEAAEKESLAHIARQRPWLQAFTASWVPGYIKYGGQQLKDQVRGAKDAGVDEWLLWNASNNYERVKSGLQKN